MSNILFANNASTVLAGPISSGATSCSVTAGTGAEFPSPTGGQYFVMTFVDAATGLLTEIVHCTARSGDTLTIARAQEGTSARSWLAGDIAANFWTAGSIAALQAGFPISSGSISTTTTLSSTDSGTLFRVSGASTIVSLPAASSVSGMVVGFSCQALSGCQIVSLGGVFAGGAVDGNTSVNLAATDFLCAQSNGTIWVIFAGSPDVLVGGTIALQSWVTANFDPLGAAAAAQATAEAYALGLAGNLRGVQSVTATTNFTGNDFGWCLRLTSAASGNANFTIDVPVAGSVIWVENNSTSFNITLKTDGTNRFYGYVSAGSYQSAAQATVVVPPRSVLMLIAISSSFWLISYNSLSFDTAGAAASAQAAAEAYTDNAIATSGYSRHSQIYASAGTFTFTIPTGITAIFGRVCGGGGAGAGSTVGNPGGCGGAGGYSEGWITGLTPGGTISITVGAGGTGVSGAAGNNGGSSSIGAFMSATGGNGGAGGNTSTSPGGSGGQGSGGEVNLFGGYGSDGTVGDGVGGSSAFGGGGRAYANTPLPAAQFAPGGGGGGSYDPAGTITGQAGRAGIVILRW